MHSYVHRRLTIFSIPSIHELTEVPPQLPWRRDGRTTRGAMRESPVCLHRAKYWSMQHCTHVFEDSRWWNRNVPPSGVAGRRDASTGAAGCFYLRVARGLVGNRSGFGALRRLQRINCLLFSLAFKFVYNYINNNCAVIIFNQLLN